MSNRLSVLEIPLDISIERCLKVFRVFTVCLTCGIPLKSVSQIKRVETDTRN